MVKFIHIKADSEVISVSQIVEESKCVKVLTTIRNTFEYLKKKYQLKDDKLVVRTCVHNPEFQFGK